MEWRTRSNDDGTVAHLQLRFRYFGKFPCGIAVFYVFYAVLRFSDPPYAPLLQA